MAGRLELALLAYGALNAILYATLLPLWDGFDEPFHYSFVQHLARTRELPGHRAHPDFGGSPAVA